MAHTAEAKATVLRQLANGTPVKELCRTYDIPRSTLIVGPVIWKAPT